MAGNPLLDINNLSDVSNAATARENLDVDSKDESQGRVDAFSNSLAQPTQGALIGRVTTGLAGLRLLEPVVQGQLFDLVNIDENWATQVEGARRRQLYAYDAIDTTSSDDGATVLVTNSGKRLKLIVDSGFISPQMFASADYLKNNNSLEILRKALSASRKYGVPLRIDCEVLIIVASASDPIEMLSSDTIEWRYNGKITTPSCVVPIFYALLKSRLTLIDPLFVFTGAIPESLPAAASAFVSKLTSQAPDQISGMPGVEGMGLLLFWLNDEVKILRPRFLAQSQNSVMNLILICIDTLRNTNLIIENAIFDGIVHGVVGSGNQNVSISATSLCRGNPNQNTSAYIPPGHVIYLTPIGNSSAYANSITLAIKEWNALEPSDSFDQSACTVSAKYIEGIDFRIISNFSQGFLTTVNLSHGNINFVYDGTSSQNSSYAAMRLLADTAAISGGYCMKNISLYGKMYLPTIFTGYFELGQMNTVTTVGLIDCTLDIEAITLAPTLYSPLFILKGSRNRGHIKLTAENISSGTPFLMNIWTPGYSNNIKIDCLFANDFSPTPRVAQPPHSGNVIDILIIKTGKQVRYAGGFKYVTEEAIAYIIPTPGTTAVSSEITIPLGATLDAITTRIEVSVGGGATSYSVGNETMANKWGTSAGMDTLRGTDNSYWAAKSVEMLTSNQTIYLTPNGGSFDGSGLIKVTAQYRQSIFSTEA